MILRLLAFFLIIAIPLRADWIEEEQKIQYLFDQILRIDGVFIRNGSEYPPRKAVEHLTMKMDRAMNSWFAPDKEKWTVEMFIDKLASESSLSGKPYLIRFKDGRIVKTRDWLYELLKQRKNP